MNQLALDTVDNLAAARTWKAENELAYTAICEWARRDQDNATKPSIDFCWNLLRRPHFASLLGFQPSNAIYRLDNSLRSEVARLVMEENPDIQFEVRKSRADAQGVYATPEVRR